jgi:hypothetical protein
MANFEAGDRFETIERIPNAQGVILKAWKQYNPYAGVPLDTCLVRFDDGHEETLTQMRYYCRPLRRRPAAQ